MHQKSGHSRYSTDQYDSKKEEHFNSAGTKIGETSFSKDRADKPIQEHFDRSGRKIGETRQGTDSHGNSRAEHYDNEQRRIGFSRDSKDSVGEPIQEHFDNNGTMVGTSREGSDESGRSSRQHSGTFFKARLDSTPEFDYTYASSLPSSRRHGKLIGWLVGLAFVFIVPPAIVPSLLKLFPGLQALTLHPIWIIPALLIFPFGPALLCGIAVARFLDSKQ